MYTYMSQNQSGSVSLNLLSSTKIQQNHIQLIAYYESYMYCIRISGIK